MLSRLWSVFPKGRKMRLPITSTPQREVRLTGRLSDSDWASVRVCFKAGFGDE
jgi:hypothetical protein